MYKTEKIAESDIEKIASLFERSQHQYNEYSFLSMNQLSDFFISRTIKSISNPDIILYKVLSENIIKGIIICTKDHFDSNIFGFSCYRVSELLVFSENVTEKKMIINLLLSSIEKELLSRSQPIYITISLNNNIHSADHIFNAIIQNQYYYIHTLLTFFSERKKVEILNYYPKEGILIRHADKNDTDQVAELAQKSFKLSRFHLDPFLDNQKASELLKTSAMNSILHGFVDVMFVAEKDNRIVGYYSAKKKFIPELNKTVGEAVISAVDQNYRGLGIFSKLDSHLLNWFSENTDFSEMGTYLANYPVHKTWINKGLGIIRGTHQFSKFLKG